MIVNAQLNLKSVSFSSVETDHQFTVFPVDTFNPLTFKTHIFNADSFDLRSHKL